MTILSFMQVLYAGLTFFYFFSVHKKIGRGLELVGSIVAGSPIALHRSASKLTHSGLAKAFDKPRDCKGNLFLSFLTRFLNFINFYIQKFAWTVGRD